MSMTCTRYREVMVPHLCGELEPLERARLESHLGHCQSCARVREELAAGLSAARDFAPVLAPAHLERLVARLGPYTEARPASRPWLWALAAASLVLLAAALLTLRTAPVAAPGIAREGPPLAPPVAAAALLRQEPSPWVRLLSSSDWDGRVESAGRATEITLRRGLVAVAFAGGQGRSLRVHLGPRTLAVVGTRFVVERDATTTFIAVAEGTVRLHGADLSLLLPAGSRREILADGTVREAAERAPCRDALAEAFLTTLVAPPPPRSRVALARLSGEDVAEQLARAEELVTAAQLDAAETIYTACVEDPDPAYTPFRELCRLHLARLYGFHLGRADAARALLQTLAASAPDEVGREAALTECELELRVSPCRAKACLERLVARSPDEPELGGEAQRLLGRWGLAARSCE